MMTLRLSPRLTHPPSRHPRRIYTWPRFMSRIPSLTARTLQRRTMSAISIPKTMKASQFDKTGGPEVGVINEIPVPEPKEGEVLVKVEYSGVNFIDNYRRSGLYPVTLPYTQGQDAVGTIVAHGPNVHSTTPPISTRVLTSATAAFAEYLTVPGWQTYPLPDDVKSEDGVVAATQGLTAISLVKEAYEVKRGDWVLVRAAAGGVGLLLVQLAKSLGAHVIGTASSEDKLELIKSFGAEHVINSHDPDAANKIIKFADGKGVHVVYDGIGKDTWEEDFVVVRPKATIVTFGNASGPVPPFSPLKLSPKCLKVIRPTLNPYISTPEDFQGYARQLIEAVQKGDLKFVYHKTYPFTAEGIAQSQTDIASRGTTGKLLIKIA